MFFFPGVELRTDKNANNLHIILIFDCESRLSELSEDFNAIMYRQKAKAKEADETIYWDFRGDVFYCGTGKSDHTRTTTAGNRSIETYFGLGKLWTTKFEDTGELPRGNA